MRMLYNGLFHQLKQSGINDRWQYSQYGFSGVWHVQQEFNMIVCIRAVVFSGMPFVITILRMGFPNKRISCKRKRRNQY